MRFKIFFILTLLLLSAFAFAATQEANVNVIVEIEGENKFEPFKEPSKNKGDFFSKGIYRVVAESDTGLPRYEAMNDAMQSARAEIWSLVVHGRISDNKTIQDAIMAAPPYTEIKDKEKMEGMTPEEKEAYIKKNSKEKRYDIEKFYSIIKECGQNANSGRYYDEVEQKGYACLEVSKNDFFRALINEKIDIFSGLRFGERYKPVDGVRNYVYDAVIVDARDTEYIPGLFIRILSPTEETVYAGIPGRKNIFFATDMDQAKDILSHYNVKKAYSAPSQGLTRNIGVRVSLPASDRIYSLVSRDRNLPIVVLYKEKEETVESGE